MATPLNVKITTPGGVMAFPSQQLSEPGDDILKIQFGVFTFEIDNSVFPQPVAASGGEIVKIVTPSGSINNTNKVFTVPTVFDSSKVEVYVNGLRQSPSMYATSAGNTITFVDAPRVGDILEVEYAEAGATGVADEDFIVGEIPAGLLNGSNATFTTANTFIPETMRVYINGVRQHLILDYTLSAGTTINFTSSPLSSDFIEVDYIKL